MLIELPAIRSLNPAEEQRLEETYGLGAQVLLESDKSPTEDGKKPKTKRKKISFWAYLKVILQEEGLRGVYRGISANVLTTVVAQGVYFLWFAGVLSLL
jgi:hypothetical protein